MGLIDRLLDGPVNNESLFGRALSMRGSSLLHDENLDPEGFDDLKEGETLSTGAAVRALLKELQTQRHYGITSPSHLFTLLHRHFSVRKGVLLVSHRDGGMIPMASAGIDRTSTYRLRLLNEEKKWIGDGRHAVLLDDEQRVTITQRLSRRDGERIFQIALLPFTHRNSLVAVLLVLDSPLLDLDPEVLNVIVGALSENAGRRLFEGRERPFDLKGRKSIYQRAHVPSLLARFQREGADENREIHAVEVDLGHLVQTILGNHPYLDYQRLLDDILDIVVLLTQPSHASVHLGGEKILLITTTRADASPSLVVHLLTSTLTRLFGSDPIETLTFRLWSAEERNSAIRDASHR